MRGTLGRQCGVGIGHVLIAAGVAWAALMVGFFSIFYLAALASVAIAGALLTPWPLDPNERHWRRACLYAGLSRTHPTVQRPPDLIRTTPTPVGPRLSIRMRSGLTADDIAKASEGLGTYYGARPHSVAVTANPDNATFVDVLIRNRDPLTAPTGTWPWLPYPDVSLWQPIPVARDEYADIVTITLAGTGHLLLAGVTRSGKSVAQSMIVAACARCSQVTLWLLDGKGVDLALWKDRAERWADDDPEQALQLLRALVAKMQARYASFPAGKVKVAPGDPLDVLIIDELGEYIARKDDKAKKIKAELRTLLAKGAGAGIIVIAATQTPTADIIDTPLRNNFTFRWALRCASSSHSDVVLGQGNAAENRDASKLSLDCPGQGWLHVDGRGPRRCRSFELTDADVRAITEKLPTVLPQPRPAPDPAALPSGSQAPTGAGNGVVDGWQDPDTGSMEAGGHVNPAPPDRRTQGQRDLEARLLGYAVDKPRSMGKLAGLVGHKPTSGSVRRALERLKEDGRMVHTSAGWISAAALAERNGDVAA